MYKHDAIVRAWLDGEQIQRTSAIGWVDIRRVEEAKNVPAFSVALRHRIKPKPIRLEYRRYVARGGETEPKSHEFRIGCLNRNSPVTEEIIEKSSYFVRWIDVAWVLVDIEDTSR